MKTPRAAVLAALCLTTTLLSTTPLDATGLRPRLRPGPVKLGVMSDLHVAAPRLLTPGPALESYLAQDPKLLLQSGAILDAAIDDLIQKQVKVVIIPGDLTKDGEFTSHLQVVRHLQHLVNHGIQVFVVPGNHDINNPDAQRFFRDRTTPVASIQPGMFRVLYHNFGYAHAVSWDPASLSYIAEPAPGVWLFAIDSCKYDENMGAEHPVVGGRIRSETMQWILTNLAAAKAAGKTVIAMMHHGVNQDFLAQSAVFPDYLVDEWYSVGPTLAAAGLKVIFTGHYHAQNAAYPTDAAGTPIPSLVDVETSSLAGYPCAYRTATLETSGWLSIESHRVTAIDADTGGQPFQEFAYDFLAARMPNLVLYQLTQGMQLPLPLAQQLEPLVSDAIIAGYEGDQVPDALTQQTIGGLVQDPATAQLGQLIGGLWANPTPADNNLRILIK